jgi:aminoglycoside 2'-N-acetyltransferase I
MGLTLTTMAGGQMSVLQRQAVVDLCSLAYQTDYRRFLVTFPDPVHVLALDGGRLVSHALWVTRWMQIGAGPLLRTAYVEGVATHVECRNRGYATAVLRCIADQIGEYDLAALSPATYGLYERLGWILWRGPMFVRIGGNMVPTPSEEVMVRRLPRTPPFDPSDPISIEAREGDIW